MSITYKQADGVGVFTIENGRLNILTMDMHEQLYRAYLKFLHDDSVKVGVIVGAGDNFCAGDDLKESDTPIRSRENPRWDDLMMTSRRTKPMIAAVNGWCLGQGMMYLTLLTDIRIAGKGARFGVPEIAYGMGGFGGATRLGLQLAPVHAAYLALTGEKVDANYAKDINLVNEVVEDEQVLERAMTIARTIASHSLLAIQTEIEGLHKGTEMSRQDAMHYAQGQYLTQRKLYRAQFGEAVDVMKEKKNDSASPVRESK